MKKRICLCIAASIIATMFCVNAWAYWKDELKVKANVAFIYDAQIEVKEEVETKEVKSDGSATIKEEKEDTVKKSEQNDIVKPDQRDLVIRPQKSAETVQENHKHINEDKPENIKESK